VLLALPVAVFFVMMIVNRDYGRMLIDTHTGRLMLGTAIAMDLMGMAMIKKIVNIKV
jgi:Flp pilus assembly protein TadB